jgi:16S rRNA (adenine1518-N6/adenine1519-N6)-dimethyltransferase
MKLSEIRQILAERGIRLTKSLGQNFLHDGNQLRRIVALAQLQSGDKVLEIGPGLGPLTRLLVESGREVLAIEKDARLVAVLQERFAGSGADQPPGSELKLRLLCADGLDFLRREPRDWHDWKLVSNLPYSVASPILVELAHSERPPERMVATLQLEVVRRLVASAGDADYGVLTLLVRLQFEPAGWFKIPAGCFFPEPEVDSGCVCLVRRDTPLLVRGQRALFARLVKLSFAQRRKVMFKLLRSTWPAALLELAFRDSGIPLQARAETVRLEQFVGLTRQLAPESPGAG